MQPTDFAADDSALEYNRFERKPAMKTNRSLLVYILLSIVTLGIYPLFF